MKATSLLKEQHQEVEGLFRTLDATEDASGRLRLVAQIVQQLTIHAAIEEEIFYPAVRGLGSKRAEDTVLEALEEHHVVELVLAELPTVDPEDENFAAKMTVLGELVERHADEEEEDMFPLAITLGDEELERLGRQMAARADELTAEAEETGPRSSRR